MSNNLYLLNGQIQLRNNTAVNTTTASSSSNSGTITTDVDIFPVGNTINPSNYIYDNQTSLLVNSTINQSNNMVTLQYFDPITGGVAPPSFNSWNYDLVSNSFLNGLFTSSSLLGENTYLYDNLQPVNANYLGIYNIDITNGGSSTGNNDTMFYSLTSQPYLSYKGVSYTAPGVIGNPTINNVAPNYTANNADSFLFTSCYFKPAVNEILIVQMVFTINNTNTLNVLGTSYNTTPNISVMVYNKVITKEMLASIGSGSSISDIARPKTYTAGPIELQYLSGGATFNPSMPSNFNFNNIPVVIADGYTKMYANVPIIYVPPSVGGQGQYLASYYGTTSPVQSGSGYVINGSNSPTVNTTTAPAPPGIVTLGAGNNTSFGHFVVGISYSYDANKYRAGQNITAELLIKNTWRSPLAVYKSYNNFSVNDLATKQIVILFGKSVNGGTFVVMNSGVAISSITNYAVTSLSNFLNIMSGIFNYYNTAYSLADHFINPSVVQYMNSVGSYNIQPLNMQPLLEGSISNPPTVLTCPGMSYMLVKAPNNANISVDPTNQIVSGQNITTGLTSRTSYFGIANGTLCSTGRATYFNSELRMLATSSGMIFANSIYLGLNTIGTQQFYTLMILPEAMFNGSPNAALTANSANNKMSIYATPASLFYININSNASSQFIPLGNQVSASTGSTMSSSATTASYNVSKLDLTVSNITII